MSQHPSSSTSSDSCTKKSGAGTAPGGGVNFQANATAIVAVHILRGVQMGWMDGVTSDLPVAVWAESGLSGDDIRVELANGKTLEIQVKKGLSRSNKLWEPLEAMTSAIDSQQLDYGLLAVAPDSSRTIIDDLAKDIIRLGQGRRDSLKEISHEWLARITSMVGDNSVSNICGCIRIQVIHALSSDNIQINAVKEMLRFICDDASQAEAAWDALYKRAVNLIEIRGRWTLKDLLKIFTSLNIPIRRGQFPASRLEQLNRWTMRANACFTITGTQRNIGIEHLLPMQLEKIPFEGDSFEDITSALSHYHKKAEHDSFSLELQAIWAARFIPHVVVVAGPGIGKSTMIKQLAYRYAADGFIVLKVELKRIASALQSGATFERVLLDHALSGSGIKADELENTLGANWVVLADGLDECGSLHDEIAKRIAEFALGHPRARIVVTTRPVGYTTATLEEWCHYRLLPPAKNQGAENLARLLTAADKGNHPYAGNPELCERALKLTPASSAIINSPQLLGMAASLILIDHTLPQTLTLLYRKLIRLFDSTSRGSNSAQERIYDRVIDVIGWVLLENPFIDRDQLVDRAAEIIAPALGKTHLSAVSDVLSSVAKWEDVGLLEQIQHQCTSYLTFIHKTFAEFVAARFLVQNPDTRFATILDQPQWNEVVNFASELGLADNVIATRISRFQSGETEQLIKGLNFLKSHILCVSESSAKLLLAQAFKFITQEHPLRFQVGVLLADITEIKSSLTTTEMESRLNDPDKSIKLIAWGIAASSAEFSCDIDTSIQILREMLPQIADTPGYLLIAKKIDPSDRQLLHRIGLMALKAQPDANLKLFSETELKGNRFTGENFSLKRNIILIKRGIDIATLDDEHPAITRTNLLNPSFNFMTGFTNATHFALNKLAMALCTEDTVISSSEPEIIAPVDCIQFAAFISVCKILECPVGELFKWQDDFDLAATQATLHTLIHLLPLESTRLAAEARSIHLQLSAAPEKRLYDQLPRVDIPEPDWQQLNRMVINVDAVKPALLHPVGCIAFFAAMILEATPMSLHELQQLVDQASGTTLGYLSVLLYNNYPQQLVPVLVKRLISHPSKDQRELLELLSEYNAQPDGELTIQVQQCLISKNTDVAMSAIDLVDTWLEDHHDIVLQLVEKAIGHWQNLSDNSDAILWNTPLNNLLRLRARI